MRNIIGSYLGQYLIDTRQMSQNEEHKGEIGRRRSIEEEAVNDQHYQQLREQQQQPLQRQKEQQKISLQSPRRRCGTIRRFTNRPLQLHQQSTITHPSPLYNSQTSTRPLLQSSTNQILSHLDIHQQQQQLYNNIYSQIREDGKQTDYVNNKQRCDNQQHWEVLNSRYQIEQEQRSGLRRTEDSESVIELINSEEGQVENRDKDNLPQQVRITPPQSIATSLKVQTISYQSSQPQLKLNSPSQIYQYQQEQQLKEQINHSNPITIPIMRQIQKPLTQVDKNSKKVNQLSMQVKGMKSQFSQLNKNFKLLMGILLEQKQKNDKLQEENAKLKQDKEKLEEEKIKLKQRRLKEQYRQRQVMEYNNIVREELYKAVFTKSMGSTHLKKNKQKLKNNGQEFNINNIITNSNPNNTHIANKRQQHKSQFLNGELSSHLENKLIVNHQYQALQFNNENEYPDSESLQTNTSHQDHQVSTKSWRMSQWVDEQVEAKGQNGSGNIGLHHKISNNSKDQKQHQQLRQNNQIMQKLSTDKRKYLNYKKKHNSPSGSKRQDPSNMKQTTYENHKNTMIKIIPRQGCDSAIKQVKYECMIM